MTICDQFRSSLSRSVHPRMPSGLAVRAMPAFVLVTYIFLSLLAYLWLVGC